MIKLIKIVVLISFICGLSHIQGESGRFKNRGQFNSSIISCRFLDESMESVQLFFANPSGKLNATIDMFFCYMKLFNEFSNTSRLNVKKLQIHRNGLLRNMDYSLVEIFPNVIDLDVSTHYYSDFTCDIFDFPHLEKFNAAYSMIERVFPCRGNLKEIDLSHNWIERISMDSFKDLSDSLTTLDLSYNKVRVIAAFSFAHQTQLREINLRNNEMKYLDMGIFNNQRRTLKIVQLHYNFIMEIFSSSSSNQEKFNLTYVDLSRNSIKQFPENILFELGPSLEYLNLSFNSMDQFIKFQHSNLRVLDLSRNRFLRTFNTTGSSERLEVLNLEGNYLKELIGISNATFPRLNAIDISMNEFSCMYATDFVNRWSNITLIGRPCNQRNQIINEKPLFSIQPLIIYSFVAAFCSVIIVLFIRYFRRKIIVQKKAIEKEKKSKEFPKEIHDTEFQEKSVDKPKTISTIEPIYYEIESLPFDVDTYDHLQFERLPKNIIQSHYHKTSSCQNTC